MPPLFEQYWEVVYNKKRLHSSPRYLSPEEFENRLFFEEQNFAARSGCSNLSVQELGFVIRYGRDSEMTEQKLGLTYIPAHLPDHIKADMETIKGIGCKEILFALQETNFSAIDGALRFGAGLAEKTGLTPYAVIWGFANTFGGGRTSNLILENQDIWRVNKDGIKDPLGCLNNPKLADGFLDFTKTCWNQGFMGMFIDEPTPQECFCEKCQQKFRKIFGAKLTDAIGGKEYVQFQKLTIVNYVENVCNGVKNLDRKLKTFCCVMPQNSEYFQSVVKISSLDVLATKPYWLLEKNKTIEWAVELTETAKKEANINNKESQVWLNLFNIPAGREEEIYSGGKKLAETGCNTVYAWSYKAALGTVEECENPARAWDYFCKLCRELSRGLILNN